MDSLRDTLAALAARFRRALQRDARSTVRLTGTITVETRDARTGERIEHECGTTHNLVVDAGLTELAKIFTKYVPAVSYEIGVGTGTNAALASDTTLQAQVLRAAVTSVLSTGAVFTAKLFLDTSMANGSTLTECGLFHNSVLIDRAIVTSVSKDATKTVTYSVSLTESR